MALNFFSGKLDKLKIIAFSDINCKVPTGYVFVAMFNPEKYTKNYTIVSKPKKGIGKSGSELDYKRMEPQQLTFEFLIDGTGAVDSNSILPVQDVFLQVNLFLKTVYKYNGEAHKPNYLRLLWGTEIIKCLFQKASVNYTMFKPSGYPLRATINATFLENISDIERQATDKTSSPDLTHKRAVKDGDHLMVMTQGIYETLDPVIQVARANDLDTIRSLPSGVNLLFPPVEEPEE